MDTVRIYCSDRDNVSVCLKHRIWYGHIILKEHDYLRDLEQYVRRAVEQPNVVNQDRGHPRRKCFYRQVRLPDSSVDEYLKVVVEYVVNAYGDEEGEIITAFTVDVVRADEERLWPSGS